MIKLTRLRFARQLYRAAPPAARYGERWTASAVLARQRAIAHSTADAPWRVWTARVARRAIVAIEDDGTIIVRTAGLEVVEFDTSWLPRTDDLFGLLLNRSTL